MICLLSKSVQQGGPACGPAVAQHVDHPNEAIMHYAEDDEGQRAEAREIVLEEMSEYDSDSNEKEDIIQNSNLTFLNTT